MRFACIADLHGRLPDLSGLEFDVLLIAGDITPHPARDFPRQIAWLDGKFRRWLERIDRPVIGCAGNHDIVFQDQPEIVAELNLPWAYLRDSGTRLLNGLYVYGAPWQLPFSHGWTFNLEEPDIRRRWAMIPDDTDILIVHGPPHGHGDWSNYGHEHTGSPSLTEWIEEHRPKLICTGHIHEARGVYKIGETVVVNSAHVGRGLQGSGWADHRRIWNGRFNIRNEAMNARKKKEFVRILNNKQKNLCRYCGVEMTASGKRPPELTDRTLDHRIPRHKQGTDELSNFVLACSRCNHLKGRMDEDEYIYRLKRRREKLDGN